MTTYYIIFTLMAISLVLNPYRLCTKQFALLWMGILALMTGFRYNVGTDWSNYVTSFQLCPDLFHIFPKNVNFEWGVYILMVIVKTIGGNYELCFFLMSAISFAALYRSTQNLFPQILGSALMVYYSFFFLQLHFNIVRHGMMTSFVWLALSYIPQQKIKLYLLWMLVATSFHITALAFIPLYWIINRHYKTILSLSILGALFILGEIFQQEIFRIGSKLSIISYKIEYYTDIYYQGRELSNNLSIGAITYTLVYLWICFFPTRFDYIKHFNIIKNALFFALCIIFLFRGTGVFSERLGSVLNISLIFIIPFFVLVYKGLAKQVCKFMLLLYCALLLFRNLSSENPELGKLQFIPYKTIFNK